MKLSLHHSFYVTLITISSSLSGMDFSGPASPQIDSGFSQLPLDIHIIVASHTNARTILNLQQTCQLWYCTLNSKAKKQIATIRNFEDLSRINQKIYNVALAATLVNFTTPEQIPLSSKEPELFLLAGANPNYMNAIDGKSYTSTSLLLINSKFACTDEIKKVLIALMHHGANVNLRKKNGHSAFHHAVRANATDMVAYLISHNANVNKKGFRGNTALHFAAENVSYDMTKLLLENGANADIENSENQIAGDVLENLDLFTEEDVANQLSIEHLYATNKYTNKETGECSLQ